MKHGTLFLAASLLLGQGLHAQDEERFLPFIMQVMMNEEPARQFTVTLYADNQQVAVLGPDKRYACELLLDVNAYYSIRVSRPGSPDKMLSVDTHLPPKVERYKGYYCVLELETVERYADADPFYLDFPNAIIRWDPDKGCFDHSDHYLEAIRAKTLPPGERLVQN